MFSTKETNEYRKDQQTKITVKEKYLLKQYKRNNPCSFIKNFMLWGHDTGSGRVKSTAQSIPNGS